VESHLKETTREFNTDFVTIKSCFRRFLDEGILTKAVDKSGDGWWHGFQHGIGIISHAAPAMYALGKNTVYFASSFTAADKGKVTCASDPTIDNFVKFCGCNVVHDGYEYTRQMKIYNITQFAKRTGMHIPLRVCWESSGGSNCCNCEKCWRTILGIYAEGFDPREFGFKYDDNQLKHLAQKIRYSEDKMFSSLRYAPIQNAMRANTEKNNLPTQIRWFYDADINKLNELSFGRKVLKKGINYARKVKHKLCV
jgi:hypothetical protein